MKKFLIYSLIISMSTLGFYACNDDDDDDPAPAQNNMPGPGSGGGAGTGGGTGSGGIPPNSMKVTVDGSTVNFNSVTGSTISGMGMADIILISGFDSISTFPNLNIQISSALSSDTFQFNALGSPELTYFTDTSKVYVPISGYLFIRNIDTSAKLVNGRFEAIMVEENNLSDSLVFTGGQFNKFYN